MSKEPHAGGILDKYPYAAKTDVEGRLVCILDARSDKRGMELILHPSRALCRHEIHELAVTDDPHAAPERTVDRVAYLAFFRVEEGGIVLVGDKVEVSGKEIGEVVGFDLTHAPNHMNVLLRAAERKTGPQLGLSLRDSIVFRSSL
jgi:kynureninase